MDNTGTYNSPEDVLDLENLKTALASLPEKLGIPAKPVAKAGVAGIGMFSKMSPVAAVAAEKEHYIHFRMSAGLNAFIKAVEKNGEYEFFYCKVGEGKYNPPKPVVEVFAEFARTHNKAKNECFHDLTGHAEDVNTGLQASVRHEVRLGAGLTIEQQEAAALETVKNPSIVERPKP